MGTSARRLVTIGYEGRSPERLVSDLVELGIDTLVDVRLTPVSRKAGLSKRGLAASVGSAGIEYLHLPELGNPRDNRDALRRGNEAARARYLKRLREPEGAAALRRVVELALAQRVALLCLEREPDTCHRLIVAEEAHRLVPALAVKHAP